MRGLETSLTFRVARAALCRAGSCAASSLTARGLLHVGRGLRPALVASRSLGTAHIRSVPLTGSPALPKVAAERAPESSPRPAAAAPRSAFLSGNWLRVLGAAGLGLGGGMAARHPASGVVLILAGLLLVAAGPLFTAAAASSAAAGVFRRHRSRVTRPSARFGGLQGTLLTAMILAAAAGALVAAGPDTVAIVAGTGVVAAAAAVLWRPQLILLVVAAFPWVDWVARSALGGVGPLWDDALLVICAALVAWSIWVRRQGVLHSVPISLPVLLMLAAAAGSIALNEVANNVAFYALRVLFQPILFYFVGFLLPKDRRWVRWAVAVFLATATLLALHGLYQYVTHAPMPGDWLDAAETDIATRAYSVVQNPNVLGGILAMGGLVTVSLTLSRASSGFRRLALLAVFFAQVAGLAVTFSRSAWIGFIIGLFALALLAYRRYLTALLLGAVVVWFAAPRVFVERLLFSLSSTYAVRSSTGLGRIWRWDAALAHIADKPFFGLGLGTFGGTTAYMFGYWSIWVDNFYLQMAAEGGVLLLVFFLWLLWRSAKGLVRAHSSTGDPYLKALTAGVFGAFIAVAVADFFAADWETLSVGIPFWFLAGLATSAVLAGSEPLGAARSAAGPAVNGPAVASGDARPPVGAGAATETRPDGSGTAR